MEIEVKKETTEDDYKVTFETVTAVSLDPAIFVKELQTNEYDRIASVYDMTDLLSTPTAGQVYFRDTSFTKHFSFQERELADRFCVDLEAMIRRLLDDLVEGSFTSTYTFSYP